LAWWGGGRWAQDKEAVDVFGWVREMYAYSIASARIGIKYDMEPVPNNQLMVQPPADEALGKAAIWCVRQGRGGGCGRGPS